MSWFGSGSHSPFSLHIDGLGPVSVSPGGQLNVMVFPSIGKTSLSSILGVELLLVSSISGSPQLAIYNNYYSEEDNNIIIMCANASYTTLCVVQYIPYRSLV